MPSRRSNSRLIPVLVALIVGAVAADLARRALTDSSPPSPAGTPAPAGQGGTDPPTPGMNAAGGRVEAAPRSVAARARARERLAAEAGRTYLAAMLLEQDSLLRRWPDARFVRPLRLAVLRTPAVLNFREEFVANVNWAVARWNGAMLPVRIEAGADSTNADIVLTWVARLDSNRTGRADLTWSARGHIVHAHVVLATHTPRGEPLDSPQMTALALHELGHALGLGHSPEPGDALHAVTRAIELTERDRRTARVLYELPPGTVK